jgi:inner membrane protein
MEPITQALLGAATAELVAGRQLGRRALGWGAVVGMTPDLDILLAPLHNGYGEWLYHRGTTHSLWFGFVMGPLMGWLLWRWRDRERETLHAWIALAVIALVTHPILDGFTPYGTQFFAPFSRERFAWNGVAIVDPFYSIILAAGVAVAASRTISATRRRWALVASLVVTTSYLFAGLAINRWVVNDLRHTLETQTSKITRIRAYPTIFQPWLRSFVVHSDATLFVGLHSLMDPGCPSWRKHDRLASSPAIDIVRASWEGRLIEWFADGDIGIFKSQGRFGEVIRIEDLRYSWSNSSGRGAWGIQAEIIGGDTLAGKIVRFDRPPLASDDLDRFLAILSGRLPGHAEGWTRPSHCEDGDLRFIPEATSEDQRR